MSSSMELINCYNSNTIQAQELRLLCLSGSLQSSSNIKSGVSSWWILQDIKEIVKERLSKLSKEATYHSFTPILKVSQPYLVSFSNTRPLRSCSEFTLLPILCLPPSLEVSRVTPILTLLPILCLPSSLMPTRV